MKIIIGEYGSEAEHFAKENGNKFMTKKEKAIYDKRIKIMKTSLPIVIPITIITIIIVAIIVRNKKNKSS